MNSERKRKTKDPCSDCKLHKDLCICHLIPRLNLKTKVSLIVHRRELKRTTNTGSLALKSLVNSEMRVRGEKSEGALDLSDLLTADYHTLLFYPADDALELNANLLASTSRPIQLLVPDGNWRQASKVHTRHPELAAIPRVKISTANTANQHLRAEHFPEGMATLEAIAAALKIIEGPEVGQQLMDLYNLKLQATLKGRGQL